MIAVNGDLDTYVLFNYGKISWGTGMRSPGMLPEAGFHAGDRRNYYSVSRTQTVFSDLVINSNVGKAGQWLFRVSDHRIALPGKSVTAVLLDKEINSFRISLFC